MDQLKKRSIVDAQSKKIISNFMKKRKMEIGQKLYTEMLIEVKGIDRESGKLEAIFSTADVDRHGDTVEQEGWDLKNFKRNPVILNSHNYWDATEVIGKASKVRVEEGKLQGTITFAIEENPKAKVIFDLYAGGFLNAFSVGFQVKKFASKEDGSRDWFTIEEAELLEVSAVSVPANARALAKQKGIDVDLIPNLMKDYGPSEETDEVSEDNKTEESDEQKPTGDSNLGEGGQSGSETDNQEAGNEQPKSEGSEGEGSGTETDESQKQVSYQSKVLNAISSIETKRKDNLKQVAVIINSMVANGDDVRERTVYERKRKINQAVRLLLESK